MEQVRFAPAKRLHLVLLLITLLLAAQPALAVPHVLTSIKPIHSLAAAVMEGVGSPDLLIEGTASEHGYVLRPGDARKIAEADVIFWVGPDLETYLIGPLANLAPAARKIELSRVPGLRLLPARPAGVWGGEAKALSSGINPHIWLSPDDAIVIVRAMAAALSAADPKNAERYRRNAASETTNLEQLKAQIRSGLAPVRGRPFIVFHDAYPYFEQAFDMPAAGAVAVAPDRPVGPRTVAQLRSAIVERHVVCIFREPQFPPTLIDTLIAGTPVRVGVLDPLGADLQPGPKLYDTMMRRIAGALRSCLSGH